MVLALALIIPAFIFDITQSSQVFYPTCYVGFFIVQSLYLFLVQTVKFFSSFYP